VRDDGGIDLAVLRPEAGGFPPHSHDEYVVSVNVRGVEQVRLDRRTFEVGTDEVTVYNPGQVQSCRTTVPEGAAWACVSMYVPAETVESTFGRRVEFERPVVRAPELRSALLAAAGPRRTDQDLRTEELTVLLVRLLERAGPRSATRVPATRDPVIAAVLDHLVSDLSRVPRLADLAERAGLSREQLIRSFTRAVGCPPYAWHLQARLAEGRRLLRRKVPIAEVAHRLAFADQAHFHKHFRAAYATTPGRFRAGVNI
jgi:AraC family chemosensory pili system transcriptional regulator ChpD